MHQQQHPSPQMMYPPPPPPPMMYPPPMFMPPPPRRGGGFVRGIMVTLATTIFGLSLTLNIYLLIAYGLFSGGGSTRSSNLVEGDPTQKVAVVPIRGAIMGQMSERFARLIKQVESDSNVKAVVIQVDSPGGTVSDSDEVYEHIRRFKAKHPNTPVVISMGGLAASGGYYVSCAADYLFAEQTTLTGNIGVLFPLYDLSRLGDKWGIEDTTISSTGTPYKTAGSWLKPLTGEQRVYLQDLADQSFARFKNVVRQGRSGHAKFDVKKLDQIANGKIYTADDAVANGLIDEKGYLADACDYAASKAGLSRPSVVKFQESRGFLDALSSSDEKSGIGSPSGSGGATTVQINGINISAADLQELMTPRLMYLWRGQ
jgi:protease-4